MCLLENRFFALTEVISLVLGVHDVAQQNIPTLKNVSRFQTTELGCSAVVERELSHLRTCLNSVPLILLWDSQMAQ